jgi:hypothetical protein
MTGTNEDPGTRAGKKTNEQKAIHRRGPHVCSRMREGVIGDDQNAEVPKLPQAQLIVPEDPIPVERQWASLKPSHLPGTVAIIG